MLLASLLALLTAVAARSCFDLSTPVTLSDGTSIPIRDIQVGMKVRSFDFSTNTTVSSTVLELLDGISDDLIKIDLQSRTSLISTADHPYYSYTTSSLVSMEPSKTTKNYKFDDDVTSMSPSETFMDADLLPVKSQINRLLTDPIPVRTLKLSDHHYFFANGILVHNKGGGKGSSSSSSSSSGGYSGSSSSSYSTRPSGYTHYSSSYYSAGQQRSYYSGSRQSNQRHDDIYYRDDGFGNVTCCEDEYWYSTSTRSQSQNCALLTCSQNVADDAKTASDIEYEITSYSSYFDSREDSQIFEKCCECGGGNEMICPSDGLEARDSSSDFIILLVFVLVCVFFCARLKSACGGSGGESVTPEDASEPANWSGPPGNYICYKCTGPVECKHFLRVAREQNDNTYREGVWICDGPCGNKHYARNNPQDQGIFRCETCKIDLDMTCVKMPQMQVQMQMPTGQQPMAMGQPLPMMMQPPMGGGQPMMIQPQGGQPMMMQMPMGGQQPMMMQPQQ